MIVTAARLIHHECPHVDEHDAGSLTASWSGDVELHALARFLDGWHDRKATHEEMTEAIAQEIHRLGGHHVRVETTWRTAGFEVKVVAAA